MKLVLDANIFISSFYWGGNPRRILERIVERLDELYISQDILDEISRVMSYPKFKTTKEIIDYHQKYIERIAIKVYPNVLTKTGSRDADDNKYLECGIAGKVDYIITGDDDLLVLEEYENIQILTPRAYLGVIQ
jgi:putative PIN family toxin of toxin-antitoxin system